MQGKPPPSEGSKEVRPLLDRDFPDCLVIEFSNVVIESHFLLHHFNSPFTSLYLH